MYSVQLLEQAGAQPADLRKKIDWSESSTCTAKLLIIEHVRAIYDDCFSNLKRAEQCEISANIYANIYNGPKSECNTYTLDELVAVALAAFTKRRVVLLVNRKQIVSLDEEVELSSQTNVIFLKIPHLRGG